MPTIHVDGVAHEVEEGQNLLQACLLLGYDLPYFCWHEAMGSVGACRQCAVVVYRDDKDEHGRIAMSCMTAASDGTRLSIGHDVAREFRKSVIEWLMVNHPHDCPVCDEGGECQLQDMTLMAGHSQREYRFKKRTYRNQDLGPFVHHEMNRCIQCYRCVRFYNDHAGGRDLSAQASHDHVYFGRHEDGTLKSPFSGNLVEVCPTGVFTDKTYRHHYARKWDLQTAPSICPHCSVGCNITPGERQGTLRRIRNRYHAEVNGWFLCDRGRYGYGYVNRPDRIRRARGREGPVPVEEARAVLRSGGRVVGIGSPRASLEANFALRQLVGEERFSAGVTSREMRLLRTVANLQRETPAATVREVEASDAVLVLGEDAWNTAPRLGLALRQAARRKAEEAAAARLRVPLWQDEAIREAVQDDKGALFLADCGACELDEVAAHCLLGAPDDVARLGYAVAHLLDPEAPPVELTEDRAAFAAKIAQALLQAERPLVVSGTSLGSLAILNAAGNVARALRNRERPVKIALVTPECDSLGVALMGGRGIDEVLGETVDLAIVLENDLYRRAPADEIDGFLSRAGKVVVLDHTESRTTAQADLVLPTPATAETSGTFVSNEGRAQRFLRVFPAAGEATEAWRWLGEHDRLDDVLTELEAAVPALRGVAGAAPDAGWRAHGEPVPRMTHRASGRTAVEAHRDVKEVRAPVDPDTALVHSMEGTSRPPASLRGSEWAPGWNSEQAAVRLMVEARALARKEWPGVRLLEPGTDGGWRGEPPARFEPQPGRLLVVEAHEVFGSEALSVLAPAVAERVPAPWVGVHPRDAEGREELTLRIGEVSLTLPVRASRDVPRGVARLPRGLPGLQSAWGILLPAWAEVAP